MLNFINYARSISLPVLEESYIACIILAVMITVSMLAGFFAPVLTQLIKELISSWKCWLGVNLGLQLTREPQAVVQRVKSPP